MKSQIQVFIFYLAVAAGSITSAQPKLSVDLGLGFYQPTLTGFDENESVPFPAAGILNRNLLLNWGVYYEFFSNARVGYNSFTSLELGKLGLINSAESIFRRTLRYRMFPIETFFRWRPKIELNFTLAPIWGRGRITVDTSPGDKADPQYGKLFRKAIRSGMEVIPCCFGFHQDKITWEGKRLIKF